MQLARTGFRRKAVTMAAGTDLETPPIDDDEADGDGYEEDDEVLVVIVLHEDVEQLR